MRRDEAYGEAAARVSKPFRAAHPEIPWRDSAIVEYTLTLKLIWRRYGMRCKTIFCLSSLS